MLKKTVSRLVLFAACAVVSVSAMAAADPTLQQVYQAAQSGNYSQAQGMMDQVLRDHPNSAKAHFVEAELLAKQNRLASAQAELSRAERLDPTLAFAKPQALQELRDRISASRAALKPTVVAPVAMAPAIRPATPHIPWGGLLGGAALIIAIAMFLRSRSRNTYGPQGPAAYGYGPSGAPQPYGPTGYGPGGYGPGAPMGQPGGMGSGIMGGLATGAAVGVGVVAGEALMHRVLDGGNSQQGMFRQDPSIGGVNQPAIDTQYDMGGNDFGVNDSTSWDDNSGSDSGDSDW
jgi:hypothetical protein